MFKKIKKEHIEFLINMEKHENNNLKILAYPLYMTSKVIWECLDCNSIVESNFSAIFKKGINRKCTSCGVDTNKFDLEFCKRIFKERGYILLENNYTNCKTRMRYWCPECEKEQSMSLDNMKRGKSCPNCANISMRVDKVIIEKVKKLGFQFINIERDFKKGVSDNININLKCDKGHLFKVNWVTLRDNDKYECKVCRGYQSTKEGKTKKEIFKEVNDYINYNNLDYIIKDCYRFQYNGESNRTFTKLIIECPRHGIYEVEKGSFLSGTNCNKCMCEAQALTIGEINLKLSEIYFDEYEFLTTDYKNAKTKYKFRHKKCKKTFISTWDNFISGDSGCPYCSKGMSKGETYLKEYFNTLDIIYTPQYTISKCRNMQVLPFDFAVFDNNDNLKFLIEVDSNIHKNYVPHIHRKYENFLEMIKRDKIKEDYCKDNNIKLYKPYYSNIKDIKQWIKDNKNLFEIGGD